MAECPSCKSVIDSALPECPKCGAKTGRGDDAWDADLDVAWMDVDMAGDEASVAADEELIDLAHMTDEHELGTAVVSAAVRERILAGDESALEDPSLLPSGIVDFSAEPPEVDGTTRAVSAAELKRMSSGEFGKVAPPPPGPRAIPDLSRDDETGDEAQATVVWDDAKGRRSSVPFGLSAVVVPDLIGTEESADGVTGATRNVRLEEQGTVPGRPVPGPLEVAKDAEEEASNPVEPAPVQADEPDRSTTWLWVIAVAIIAAAASGIIALALG